MEGLGDKLYIIRYQNANTYAAHATYLNYLKPEIAIGHGNWLRRKKFYTELRKAVSMLECFGVKAEP